MKDKSIGLGNSQKADKYFDNDRKYAEKIGISNN